MTASILLLAMTRHLTQDVAPVPFLWVLPLSIYLLSFILCFDAPRYYYRPGFLVALPIAFLALDQVVDGGSMPVPLLVACCRCPCSSSAWSAMVNWSGGGRRFAT
jgi:hypothetical protein